ncbi:hypothetical protein [Azospirillum agricola]|uniref:hypothetical protein n=1 Tax=Azospirillum agricola TaxID=1720247 RepID=UPI000A0F3802|nr:hypothetical protein [Azospirillum agricola]SMH62556.1 hypothetical protein SAMN02982994_6359 [Azospirillum lipoferum]
MTGLSKPAIWELIDALSNGPPTEAGFYLYDLSACQRADHHDNLHTLAASIAKGVPAAALALALVYDHLSHVRLDEGNAEQQTAFDRRLDELRAEVGGWAAILKARTYHARLADWKAKQPRSPKLVKTLRHLRRTSGRGT